MREDEGKTWSLHSNAQKKWRKEKMPKKFWKAGKRCQQAQKKIPKEKILTRKDAITKKMPKR